MGINKRIVLIGVLLVAAIGLVVASGQGEGPAAGAVTTLRVYPQGYTPREQLETERITPPQYLWVVEEQYEALHPDIDIEFVPEIRTGYEEWFLTQMTGGTAPDIVWYQRGYIQRDYQKGWLADLTDVLDEPNPYAPDYERWYDIFQEPVIESGRAPDGRIYMLTGDIVGTGIFYNKDLFEEAGITSEPDTWSEFLDAQQQLLDIGVTPFATSMDLATGIRLYGSWFTREIQDVVYNDKMEEIKGGEVARTWKPGQALPSQEMVRAIVDGRYSAVDPEFKEMLRILKEWSAYWPEGFWAIPNDNNQVFDLWITGEAAMGWFGSWMTKPINEDPLRTFEWGVLDKIPTITTEDSPFGGSEFPAMAGVGGAFQYAIPEVTKDRGTWEAAVDYMRYITNPPTLVEIINDHGGFAPGVKDTTGALETIGVYTQMMEEFGTERIEPFDSMLTREFLDEYYTLLQLFLMGENDLDTTAELIQEEMMTAANQLLLENPDW